jgi:uncharacterized membrane protein YbhN (UPF0104 family)
MNVRPATENNPRTPELPKSPAPRRILPKLLISLLLGGLFAWLAERGGVPIFPKGEHFAQVHWDEVGFATLLLFVLTVLRATRWRFLIAPVRRLPLREVILVNWVGFFAIFALPLRLGEFVRPALTKLRAGIPISAGLGTVAVERVLDGTITSLCVAWVLWSLPRIETTDPIARAVPYYAGTVLLAFTGALIALGAFLWQRTLAVKLTERVFRFFDAKLAYGLLFETLLYWGTNACFMWVLGRACGLPLSLGHAVAVMGVLALGILLPSGPGLFGNFQVSASAALKLYFPASLVSAQGSVFVFLLYALNALMMAAIGVIPILRMHIRLGDLVSPRIGESELPPPMT